MTWSDMSIPLALLVCFLLAAQVIRGGRGASVYDVALRQLEQRFKAIRELDEQPFKYKWLDDVKHAVTAVVAQGVPAPHVMGTSGVLVLEWDVTPRAVEVTFDPNTSGVEIRVNGDVVWAGDLGSSAMVGELAAAVSSATPPDSANEAKK